ncbi:hypothetical protein AB1K83_06225 [Sporosarcina sp. 179-K 3D1 HS]|uniref:hypothetical protein n=1 Tax=Sporosarcina sp. 179-K 3D1 HS TaxID=3232169 RepID=UPI0039A12CDE
MNNREKRSLIEEQRATVERAFEVNDINLKDIEAGLTLYKSIIRAKERAGKRKGYKQVLYLFDKDQRKALIQIIKELPEFWTSWKEQQKKFEASSYNEDYRPSIHRIDTNGHYALDNISMLPYGEHLQENAVVTGFFGTKDDTTYFEYFHSITEASNFFGIPAHVLKKIENQAVNINGFVGMYARIEQRPARPKAEQDRIDKADYQSLKSDIERFEAMPAGQVSESLLAGMKEKLMIFEANGFHLL